MINKIYKSIHNKYSTLFKFVFFLRYLFGIFLISVVLFLSIPHFFDLEKKDESIKRYLLKNYGLTLNRYGNIKYNLLPKPNFEIQNVNVSIKKGAIPMDLSSLIIYPKLYNIYNFENLEANKIFLDKNKILLSVSDFKILIYYIYNLKNKVTFKNLNIKIERKNESLINLNKIYFSNYGYNKNIIKGEMFNKEFEILLSDDRNKISFELLKTGIIADITFKKLGKQSTVSGVFKSNLLNSKLKFNFDYDDKKLNMYNSYFRSKNLSFNNKSSITHSPFFFSSSIFEIEDINIEILKNININEILAFKNLIKKLNIENEIIFKSKKFSRSLIDDLNLNINLTYGSLGFVKKIYILDNFFSCKGDINLLEEYPILYFDCSIISDDKKDLLKQFSIKYKDKNELFNLNVKGNINILNNKIKLKKIIINQDDELSKDDLNYFKESFQSILFDKNFVGIFNYTKIKDFILEIS